MTDRLAELGALQYAVENLSTAGTNPNRLGLAGYIHAAYIEYQTWAAANPGVNPNRLSARGRIYGYFYDNASWSPSSLFANSEVGAWYDPSDISTMFQDSAGTTPVTADGQPVGLILDKSKGLVLGPETFSVFNVMGAGWVNNGDGTYTATTASTGIEQNPTSGSPYLAGKTFIFSYEIISRSAGSVRPYVNGSGYGPERSSPGIYSDFCVAVGALPDSCKILGFSGFTGTVRPISIKEIPGNHASQATAASRPLYKTDGTYSWLQFDGVDDSLSTAAGIGLTQAPLSTFFSFKVGDVTTAQTIWMNSRYKSSILDGKSLFTTSAVKDYISTIPTLAIATKYVVTENFDAAFDVLFRTNGGNADVVTGSLDGSISEIVFKIGQYTGNQYLNGNIYSLIIRGAPSATQEITNTETWVNSKTGAWA